MTRFFLLHLTAVWLACISAGCASASDFKRAEEEARSGNWGQAVVYYQRSLDQDPDNIEYRMALQRALLEASHFHAKEAHKYFDAEDWSSSARELELAVDYDPSNQWIQDQLALVHRRLAERESIPNSDEAKSISKPVEMQAILDPSSAAPIRLKFAEGTSLRQVFEALSELAGVNILFDESFRDKRVTVDLTDVSFEEALDILVRTNGLFYKVLRPSAVIIAPDKTRQQ
jgi:tetratricopeptide (TPR) repeat protein